MNKFLITDIPPTDETKPVLYKILIGNRYYLHKGKQLKQSAERFLDEIFRGIRKFKYREEYYHRVVEYCKLHPQIYKVSLKVILNAEARKVLKKEKSLLNNIISDPESLNTDEEQYIPEWMIKDTRQKRCDNPITEGIVNGKKLKFTFCPNCGRINK